MFNWQSIFVWRPRLDTSSLSYAVSYYKKSTRELLTVTADRTYRTPISLPNRNPNKGMAAFVLDPFKQVDASTGLPYVDTPSGRVGFGQYAHFHMQDPDLHSPPNTLHLRGQLPQQVTLTSINSDSETSSAQAQRVKEDFSDFLHTRIQQIPGRVADLTRSGAYRFNKDMVQKLKEGLCACQVLNQEFLDSANKARQQVIDLKLPISDAIPPQKINASSLSCVALIAQK